MTSRPRPRASRHPLSAELVAAVDPRRAPASAHSGQAFHFWIKYRVGWSEKAGPNDALAMKDAFSKIQTQIAHARGVIAGCAADLAALDAVIARELPASRRSVALAGALAKQRAVRGRLDEIRNALAGVDRTIDGAMRQHVELDAKLTALIEQEEAARRSVYRDPLTGLADRTLFANRLDHGLEQAKRRKWTLAVMVLEIDRLGAVNDLFGREAGDEVLKTIARRLSVATRGEDTVGRGGGSEFLYLLMDFRDAENVAMIAERFVGRVSQPCEIAFGGSAAAPSVTVAIGVAIYPKDGATAAQLMKAARAALAKAKAHRIAVALA
jgi:diguanylate cyclase (GGDEF)-like protein